MLFRRLVRQPGGGIRVTLPNAERAVLLDVATTLRQVIAGVDADTPPDELTGRLFPRAYEDPLEEMEYADAMMGSLVDTKRTLLDTFVDTLHGGRTTQGRWRTDLDPDQVEAWLAVLQDGRQVLSRVVGIETEADWERVEEIADEREDHAVLVLAYLGDLLNGMVLLLMGGLDDA
ncbi:DUF2017 family protein [Euzebya sp.]|uniref:DUF2017 family protein n=1 Tax=Euzebya sp. TaxID=1971409 RepID=UPI003511711B